MPSSVKLLLVGRPPAEGHRDPLKVLSSVAPRGGSVRGRNQEGKLHELASVERKVDDALVFDHVADRRRLGVEQRRRTFHVDDPWETCPTPSWRSTRTRCSTSTVTLSTACVLEPGQLSTDRVGSGLQERNRIESGFVGHRPFC